MITDIGSQDEFAEALKSDKLVVAMFKAKWCRSCKSMGMPFKKLVNKHGGDNIEYCFIDYNACTEVCKEQDVTSLPTFKFFKDGLEVF